MAAKKQKKSKKKEPDLFTSPESSKRKPKEWEYPEKVKYSDVKVGDIFHFKKKCRNWSKDGKLEEYSGEVLEKGSLDSSSKYFKVRIIHPDSEGVPDEDIRQFILRKK